MKLSITSSVLTALLSLAPCFIHAQSMTEQQQAFVAVAALEAKGDIAGLKKALNDGFNCGLTVSEAKEALSQLYAYTGFPRSLNGLGTLQQVLKDRDAAGLKTEQGREASALPADYDALKQGTEVQTRLTGRPFNYTFAPQTDYYLKAHLFGDIFARDNLTFAEREIVTVSALSALRGCEPQLLAHVSGARNMGVSDAELRAIPTVLRQRVGEEEAGVVEEGVSQAGADQQPHDGPDEDPLELLLGEGVLFGAQGPFHDDPDGPEGQEVADAVPAQGDAEDGEKGGIDALREQIPPGEGRGIDGHGPKVARFGPPEDV